MNQPMADQISDGADRGEQNSLDLDALAVSDRFRLFNFTRRDDPALAATAIEELLRYDSPVQASRRITLEPITIRDITIPAGAFVMASLASANRDEGFWGDDASELRITRQNARQHVSFGAGHHHCLGASLARLEAAIAIEQLVSRFPGVALDGEVTWNGRINLRGPAHLPVSVSKEPARAS